jgi:hypothetical protein
MIFLDAGSSSRLSTAFTLTIHIDRILYNTIFTMDCCSYTSNKRSYEHVTLGWHTITNDDEGCPALKRFKKNVPNEPWSQAALQLLSKTNKDIHHGKLSDITNDQTSQSPRKDDETCQRKALRTSIRKDICHINKKLTDMNKTTDMEQSRRKSLLTKVHSDIFRVKKKLADLEEMVYSAADAKEFQHMLETMENLNLVERLINDETPKQVIEDMVPAKLTDPEKENHVKLTDVEKENEKAIVSRRAAAMDVSLCLATPRRRAISRKKASDYFGL